MKLTFKETWWQIGRKPNLDFLPEINKEYKNLSDELRNQPNDHHIFQNNDGKWELWACVRNTKVGRCLVNWTTGNLTDSPWKQNQVIRADRNAGESLVDWKGQEFLQSPFIVKENGKYYMFYGGYATGFDCDGNPTDDYGSMENQISLMLSDDGVNWSRHKNDKGYSRVFVGPGAARDQMLIKFDGIWHMYYTGHFNKERKNEAIFLRTSQNLIDWSDYKIVHYVDEKYRSGITCESPFVLKRKDGFYLFRSGGYKGDGNGSVAIFKSDNPIDFGISGDGKEKYFCNINGHAGEVITGNDGKLYLSKIHDESIGYCIHLTNLTIS